MVRLDFFRVNVIIKIGDWFYEDKFKSLTEKDKFLEEYYTNQNNGFYQCKNNLSSEEKKKLKDYFNNIGFTALNFTDSRGIYQYYNLSYLWGHIEKALENNIKILNLATEPISIQELYKYIRNADFTNHITDNIPNYNLKTKYDKIFNGNNGYIFDKKFVLEDIKKFVEEMQ